MPYATDPNPTTNPGLRLQCANCKAQGITVIWDWHLPASPWSATGYTTDVDNFDAKDELRPLELNAKYPHCPRCESHAVNILGVYDPTVTP